MLIKDMEGRPSEEETELFQYCWFDFFQQNPGTEIHVQ